jgi:hypothetical protein
MQPLIMLVMDDLIMPNTMRTPFFKGFPKLPSNSYKVSELSETIPPYRNQMDHLVSSICLMK